MNQIELHHLRCLVTLAEELNFGRAAERLHMSQPPLTRILFEVERVVGARLFERTTRRVRLTAVGEVFIIEARAVLARMGMAMDTVRAAVRHQSGQLRLAYTPLALMTVLPQIVSSLREREHDVSVDLVELPAGAQRESLHGGHVDMSFADEPIELDGFTNVLLHRESLRVLVPSDHRFAGENSLPFVALAEETIILHARHEYPRYHDRVIGACAESGFSPNVYHREAQQNCLALVTAGQGILLSPAKVSHTFASGLRCLPLEDAPSALCTEVWAVLPTTSGSLHLETLRRVIQQMVEIVPCGMVEKMQ